MALPIAGRAKENQETKGAICIWCNANNVEIQATGFFAVKILLIAGARPNFMKIAPIYRGSLKYEQLVCKVVHTGQHYDYEMSRTFIKDLEIR